MKNNNLQLNKMVIAIYAITVLLFSGMAADSYFIDSESNTIEFSTYIEDEELEVMNYRASPSDASPSNASRK